uniref:HNH endonuclease n=1 Tax=Paenibacillus sp. FSL H7-0350 TaxID=2975345 RepID=UPI00406D3427
MDPLTDAVKKVPDALKNWNFPGMNPYPNRLIPATPGGPGPVEVPGRVWRSQGTGKIDNTPPAFKQTEFASSYEARLSQTPAPENPTVGFEGTRGESKCTLKPPPDSEVQIVLNEAGIDGIQYKNAVPDFSPVAKAQVEIEYMLGGKGIYGGKARRENFIQSDSKLAEQLNSSPELARQFGMDSGKISVRDIKIYREKNNLTWHELNDVKTMQLVPTNINSTFGHLGGVGEINAGAFEPGGFAK